MVWTALSLQHPYQIYDRIFVAEHHILALQFVLFVIHYWYFTDAKILWKWHFSHDFMPIYGMIACQQRICIWRVSMAANSEWAQFITTLSRFAQKDFKNHWLIQQFVICIDMKAELCKMMEFGKKWYYNFAHLRTTSIFAYVLLIVHVCDFDESIFLVIVCFCYFNCKHMNSCYRNTCIQTAKKSDFISEKIDS